MHPCTRAERVSAAGAKGMPVAHGETQVFFHRPASDDTRRVVRFERQRVVRAATLELDLADAWKIFSVSDKNFSSHPAYLSIFVGSGIQLRYRRNGTLILLIYLVVVIYGGAARLATAATIPAKVRIDQLPDRRTGLQQLQRLQRRAESRAFGLLEHNDRRTANIGNQLPPFTHFSHRHR